MTELTPEQIAAAKEYAAEEVEKLIDEKAGDIQSKVDEAYAAGMEAAQADASLAEPPSFWNQDPGNVEANYQDELRPLILELKAQGIRGAENLRNHPRVRAMAARHGR